MKLVLARQRCQVFHSKINFHYINTMHHLTCVRKLHYNGNVSEKSLNTPVMQEGPLVSGQFK